MSLRNKEVVFKPGTERGFDTFLHFSQSELSPHRTVPIRILCSSEIPYIFYNTEQMTRPECLELVKKLVRRHPPVEVWDYSSANAAILETEGIKARHVPLVSPAWYIEKLKSMRGVCEYDVGFCGSKCERRMFILNELRKHGLSVHYVRGLGDDRDSELAKCRVHINIHFSPSYMVFEQLRCEPWIQVGVPIVSEHSLDDDDRVINVSYDNLVNTTVELIKKLREET